MSLDSLSTASGMQNVTFATAVPARQDKERSEVIPDAEAAERSRKNNLPSSSGSLVDVTS